MRDDQWTVLILYCLRNNPSIPLDDLFMSTMGSKTLPNSTSGGIYCSIIINLFKARFIKFSDKEITAFLKKYKGSHSSLGDGYGFLHFLEQRQKDIALHDVSVELTDHFYRIQDVIGFSISDLYEKATDNRYFNKPDPKTLCDVFVIMPFSEKMTPVYEDHIRKVCDNIGLDCKRADLVLNTESIINDIWSLISNAQIIICDCTGKNPNVFYELGLAHALGKKTICITQNNDDIPFDIKHLRYIKYEYTPRGMKAFEEQLERFIGIANSESFFRQSN